MALPKYNASSSPVMYGETRVRGKNRVWRGKKIAQGQVMRLKLITKLLIHVFCSFGSFPYKCCILGTVYGLESQVKELLCHITVILLFCSSLLFHCFILSTKRNFELQPGRQVRSLERYQQIYSLNVAFFTKSLWLCFTCPCRYIFTWRTEG